MHLQTLSPSVVVQVLMIDLASQNFQDLRPILTEYKQVSERKKISIPEEFARREAMAREVARSPYPAKLTLQALQKTLKPTPTADAGGSSFVSRLFGLRALPPVQTPTTAPGDVVLPLDLVRAQAAEGYEQIKKWIEEHGQEILEEDKKREQQMMAEASTSLLGFFSRLGSGGVPPPPSSEGGKANETKSDETSK